MSSSLSLSLLNYKSALCFYVPYLSLAAINLLPCLFLKLKLLLCVYRGKAVWWALVLPGSRRSLKET